MIAFPHAAEQRALTSAAITEAGLPIGEVWLHYFSLSGDVDEYEVEAYLTGIMQLPPLECDLLALAVNELIDELPPRRRAPFREDLLQADAAAGKSASA